MQSTVLFIVVRLAVLMPTTLGNKSDIIPIEKWQCIRRDKNINTKQTDGWNYVISYVVGDWYYYIPRPAGDTICVWFDPPVACSLIAICRTGYNAGMTPPPSMPYEAFVAYTAEGVTLDSFNFYEEPGPSPIGEWIVPPTEMWSPEGPVVWWDTLWVHKYVGTSSFLGGYIVLVDYQTPVLSDDGSHPSYRSLQFRNDPPGDAEPGWYNHYVNFGIIALVYLIEPFITTQLQVLSWTYSTEPRRVEARARLWGSYEGGIEWMKLVYNVNGGDWTELTMECIDTILSDNGMLIEGKWVGYIPGCAVGDSVSYYAKACTDGYVYSSDVYWYKVVSGTAGNILFYNDDKYYGEPYTPDVVGLLCEYDHWDYQKMGVPDSSVIAFYTPGCGIGAPIILWSSEEGKIFADLVEAGHIQRFLDAGGRLLISGQDFFVGLSGGDWETEWEPGDFTYDYLKIFRSCEEGGSVDPFEYNVFYGDTTDPISAPFANGITVWPYISIGLGHNRCGTIIETDATPIFFYETGEISAVRYEDTTKGYRYVFLYWPFTYIVEVEGNTWTGEFDVDDATELVGRILEWFEFEAIEESESPARLQLPSICGDYISIDYEVSKQAIINATIYDVVGREVDYINLKVTGRGRYVWKVTLPAGVYFVNLSIDNIHRMHKILKLQ